MAGPSGIPVSRECVIEVVRFRGPRGMEAIPFLPVLWRWVPLPPPRHVTLSAFPDTPETITSDFDSLTLIFPPEVPHYRRATGKK